MRNGYGASLQPAIGAPTYGELNRLANPQTAGQPETLRYWFYDTELFTSASTRDLTFFATTKGDRTLSNMQSAGTLPDPQFFAIETINVDFFPSDGSYVTTEDGVGGMIDDVGRIVLASRGIIEFEMSNKVTGPFPLSITRSTGGPVGFGWGTNTAAGSQQYANNGIMDGGARFDRALIIPPLEGFVWRMRWPAVVTLTTNYYVRLTMAGILSRKVA